MTITEGQKAQVPAPKATNTVLNEHLHLHHPYPIHHITLGSITWRTIQHQRSNHHQITCYSYDNHPIMFTTIVSILLCNELSNYYCCSTLLWTWFITEIDATEEATVTKKKKKRHCNRNGQNGDPSFKSNTRTICTKVLTSGSVRTKTKVSILCVKICQIDQRRCTDENK
jgi:hypothetical protein